MVELDSRVETRGTIALVELVIRNPTATARRIRVGNRLDGPIWPPRREGVPVAGWDDGGFEGVVAAESRRALGYASPVSSGESTAKSSALPDQSSSKSAALPGESPSTPPAEIVWSERAGDSESPAPDATPESVLRSLGDPRPPADTVPTPRSNCTSETNSKTTNDYDSRRPRTTNDSQRPRSP